MKRPVSQERDRIRTAYHEAGHAVVAYVCGFVPYRATIKAGLNETGWHKGEVRLKVSEFNLIFAPRLSASILFGLAGIAAQNRYSRDRLDNFDECPGGEGDMRKFYKEHSELMTLTDFNCLDIDEFKFEAIRVVRHYWTAIVAFAKLLLERETIENDELREALCLVTRDLEYLPLSCCDMSWLETFTGSPLPFARYSELEMAAAQFGKSLSAA